MTRASAPGESALLMADVADLLAMQGIRYAVIGAMAAAVHGVVRASLDADAVVTLQIQELNRTRQVTIAGATLEIIGREDLVALKAFAGGRVDLADARAVMDLDRGSLDVELLRRLAQRFGRETAKTVEDLIGALP